MANIRDVIGAIRWSRCMANIFHRIITGDNERQTRYSLIDPILDSLGWDVSDPRVIRVEVMVDFKRGNFKRADYVFFDGKTKSGVIEAKAYKKFHEPCCEGKNPSEDPDLSHFSFDDEERKQLYSLTKAGFNVRKGRAVLTDGVRWEIYDPRYWKPGQNWSKKLRDRSILASVCLIRNQGVVSKTLYKYLRRGSF